MDSETLRHTQLAYMTPVQDADYQYEKSGKVTDVYDESTLSNISIEGVDPSTWHSLRE